jgi:CRISPR-associated protein Csh1
MADKDGPVFQRLLEFSRFLPPRPAWERLNEGMPDHYDRGIALCLDDAGHWCGAQVRFGSQGVIYRSGPPNGTDFTTCSKLAKSTAQRLLKGMEALAGYAELGSERAAWLRAAIAGYQRSREAIWAEVEERRREAGIDDKDHRGYVYLARAGLADPVYAWDESKDFMLQQFLESFRRGGVRHGTCFVCGGSGREVLGNYSVIACYNLDKRGSIAGGFSVANAHRNLPVCADCALALAEAFAYGERHFTSSMAGQSYMVFPYADSREIQEELRYRLEREPRRFDLGQAHDLVAQDLEIRRELAGYGDQLAFALVLFSADQASWRVRAEVQHLLPSRMETLSRAAKEIAAAQDLQTMVKDEVKPVQIAAATFRLFAGFDGKDSGEVLRGWLVALLEARPIDARHFLHLLVTRLMATGKGNPGQLPWMTRQAWGLYRYALATGLAPPPHPQTTEDARMQGAIPAGSPYGRYIEAHRGFFRRPELVVAFLTGCYVSQVASVQRQARGAAPFEKKFVGRLLGRGALKDLYREGHGKLAQYDKLGYVITGLDPDLAAAWVACEDQWGINEDEATFAFTIGYSLAYRIHQLYGRGDDQETEQ